MKKLLYLVLVVFVTFSTKNTNLKAQSLKVDLKIENPILSKSEPLRYQVSIINLIDKLQSIDKTMVLEYKREGINKWITLQESTQRNSYRFRFMNIFTSGPTPTNLKGLDTLKFDFKYMMFEGSYTNFNYIFQEGDKFKVRVAFQPNAQSEEMIYSNPVKVQITGYEGVDNQVLQYLETTPQPHILYESLILPYMWGSYFGNTKYNGVEIAKTIINDYPPNRYTPWAYLHLAWYECISSKERKDKAFNVESLTRATNYAEQCLVYDDPVIRSLVKMIYELIVLAKFEAGMYKELDDYLNALDYVDNL